jgi:hypothetical protein
MTTGIAEGMPHALRSLANPSMLQTGDPGPRGGGTYSNVDTNTMQEQYENIFGPAARDIKVDEQRHKRHQRWHLPDALKGANPYLTDRVDGLITDSTNSPFTRNILPYVYLENPDQKIKWNVYNFDEGIASRVPYEAAARVLPQSKRSFAGYVVRQGLAIAMEHNFMVSEAGRQNFKNQLLQLVGSIQLTNDLDVHMALLMAPSYQKQQDEKYMDNSMTTSKLCRQYIDLFGIVQKNENALDILIEDAKNHLKTWGSPPPTFMLCNGALTRQLTMTPERTNYLTNGPDGAARLAQGPELPSYRGLSIINTRKFSMESGQVPRDLLRRRVRVSEHYHAPFVSDSTPVRQTPGVVQNGTKVMGKNGQGIPDILMTVATPDCGVVDVPQPARIAFPDRHYELYDQSRDSMTRFSHAELYRMTPLGSKNRATFLNMVRHLLCYGDETPNCPTIERPSLFDLYQNKLSGIGSSTDVVFLDCHDQKRTVSIGYLDVWFQCDVLADQDQVSGAQNKLLTLSRQFENFHTEVNKKMNEIKGDNQQGTNAATAIGNGLNEIQNKLDNALVVFSASMALMTQSDYLTWKLISKILNAIKNYEMIASEIMGNDAAIKIQEYLQSVEFDSIDKFLESGNLEIQRIVYTALSNVCIGCDLFVLRPNIEHEMLGIMMGRGGTQELGCTFWGQTELSCYDDAQHGIWGMSYKYHERAIVLNERNLIRVFDVAFDGYNGGMDDKHVDWNSSKEMNDFVSHTSNTSVPYQGASMLVMALPCIKRRLPNPLVLSHCDNAPIVQPDSGKRCLDIQDHFLSTHAPCAAKAVQHHIEDIMRFTSWSDVMTSDDPNSGNTCIGNTTESSLFSFSGQFKILDHHMNIVEERQGSGHLGPSYVGAASVREGRGISIQPGRPSVHRLV